MVMSLELATQSNGETGSTECGQCWRCPVRVYAQLYLLQTPFHLSRMYMTRVTQTMCYFLDGDLANGPVNSPLHC